MSNEEQEQGSNGRGTSVRDLPVDRLRQEAQGLGTAAMDKVVSTASGKVSGLTDKLTEFSDSGGAMPKAVKGAASGENPIKTAASAGMSKVKDTMKNAFGGGGSSGKGVKSTNIVEEIDVPVSRSVAYNKWTQLEDFPTFMKKVEDVEQIEDNKVRFKAQIFWSHRTWEATILEQVPDEKIVWRSSGEKGHVDGAVTFHELAPNLTRILLVMEYYPQGFFEKTGNLWRAPGRRARLEFKHFRRELSTQTLLHPEEQDGWRGEVHDEEVTKSDEDARNDEQDQDDEQSDKSSDSGGKGDGGQQRKSNSQEQSQSQRGKGKQTSSQQESSGKQGSVPKQSRGDQREKSQRSGSKKSSSSSRQPEGASSRSS